MLTRLLCLANIIITSSAIRRGPYWHLLEACLYSQSYVRQTESVLRSAAKRMGLQSFLELFEAYASQIAYSIRLSRQDFSRLPPHLIGYKDRKECARATFRLFSSANVLTNNTSEEETLWGYDNFRRHCLLIEKSITDGLKTCFPEIVGYQITTWVSEYCEEREEAKRRGADLPKEPFHDDVVQRLSSKLEMLDVQTATEVRNLVETNVDGIIMAIVRTIGDMEYKDKSQIVQTLKEADTTDHIVRAFRTMVQYRRDQTSLHTPNLPYFSTRVVLDSLKWLEASVKI